MHLTNTYLSKSCDRKCLVYVDGNGHYNLVRYSIVIGKGWSLEMKGRIHFKKFESLQRAVNKWIK